MQKKIAIPIVVVIILAVAGGAIGYHYYQKSQKSGFVKGAENVEKVFTGK